LWSVSDVAAALGITRQSVFQAIAEHRLPAPDYRVGTGPRATLGWRETTIRRWANRTGRELRAR
jgi:predicted DNA-binding transcriptional regulator AlpA